MTPNLILRSRVSADGMLHLNLPENTFNPEVEVLVIIKPLPLAKPFPVTRVEDGLGCAGYPGPAKSLEDMEQGVLFRLKPPVPAVDSPD